MKKKFVWFIIASMLSVTGCNVQTTSSNANLSNNTIAATNQSETEVVVSYENMSASEIVKTLTLQEKANQMVIPAIYNLREGDMANHNYGSILSTYDRVKETASDWAGIVDHFQDEALAASAPIPFIYGQDSVHGVNYCTGTVIFPHNINLGAANNEDLTYEMGKAVADEILMTKMIWNYAPCVAVSSDPRWGRTYESYSSDVEIVKGLSGAFTKGLLEGSVVACPKHFIGDGSVVYGTGENDGNVARIIDRGDAILTEEEIQAQLEIYKNLIDLGVQSIMVSHSSLNGVKMHENAHYLTDVLRGELGFEGVIISDWDSIHNIQGAYELKEQVIIAVNAGIDLLMEPDAYGDCATYLVEAVEEGRITEERIDEAVTRIIQLKMDAGLFEDPYLENVETKQSETGSEEYRDLACQLVEESLVLIKNENQTLPIKPGTKVFVTGPAADDTGVQCGGWTLTWGGATDDEVGSTGRSVEGATTILEGLEAIADEYQLTIITDEGQAAEADITLLCVGEHPYAEWEGDTEDLQLTGELGLEGNKEAIELAKQLAKPTVTLIVAGRNVIIDEYLEDWDSVVMCYLPGSEGQGVGHVLTGKSDFKGKLAMPWYSSIDDIATQKAWLNEGYGLTYNKQ